MTWTLNGQAMNTDSAGHGVTFTITPQQLASLRHDLQGLKPVIVSITPHTPVLSFLEL